jgi:hypothetical protein
MDEEIDKNYAKNLEYQEADLTQLQNQFAVFALDDNCFYKPKVIDNIARRYEAAGERISRWIHFEIGVLFNFTNEKEFDFYYEKYLTKSLTIRKKDKEYFLKWFKQDDSRICFNEEGLAHMQELMRIKKENRAEWKKFNTHM